MTVGNFIACRLTFVLGTFDSPGGSYPKQRPVKVYLARYSASWVRGPVAFPIYRADAGEGMITSRARTQPRMLSLYLHPAVWPYGSMVVLSICVG